MVVDGGYHVTDIGGYCYRGTGRRGVGPYGGLSMAGAVHPGLAVGGDGVGGTRRSRPTEDFVAGCRLCGGTGCCGRRVECGRFLKRPYDSKKPAIPWDNVIKIVALAEDGKAEEMSTSETVCSFS